MLVSHRPAHRGMPAQGPWRAVDPDAVARLVRALPAQRVSQRDWRDGAAVVAAWSDRCRRLTAGMLDDLAARNRDFVVLVGRAILRGPAAFAKENLTCYRVVRPPPRGGGGGAELRCSQVRTDALGYPTHRDRTCVLVPAAAAEHEEEVGALDFAYDVPEEAGAPVPPAAFLPVYVFAENLGRDAPAPAPARKRKRV